MNSINNAINNDKNNAITNKNTLHQCSLKSLEFLLMQP